MAQRALERHISADRLLLIRLRLAWPQVVPPSLVGRTWPSFLEREVLVIDVCDNQWLHELTYLQADVLKRVRRHLPRAPITGLRFRLGTVPESLSAMEPERKDQGPRLLPREPSPDTLEALEQVRDPDLRQAIASARLALSNV